MSRWYEMIFAVLIAGLAVGCDTTQTDTDETLPEPDTTAAPIEDADGVRERVPDNVPADTGNAGAARDNLNSAGTDPAGTNRTNTEPTIPNAGTTPQSESQGGENSSDTSSDSPVEEEPVDSLPEQNQDGSQ